MILFWVVCTVLLVIALAFILPTALQRSPANLERAEDERKQANIAIYRDQLNELKADLENGIVSQEQFSIDRDEIERRLLEDADQPRSKKQSVLTAPSARTAYLLAIGIPCLAVAFYLKIGEPKSITGQVNPRPSGPMSSMAEGGGRSEEQIEANVAALAKRLQTNPSDLAGWTMLARSYNSMQRYGEAAGAYAKATDLSPKDADLWAEYAMASAMANGRELQGKPTELINQALKVDPKNAKALQLAGTAAFQSKNYKKAIEYWEQVLSQVPADSEVAQAVKDRINEAKTQGNLK
jgi:cytochrome c-type biogenesis protein CcmH